VRGDLVVGRGSQSQAEPTRQGRHHQQLDVRACDVDSLEERRVELQVAERPHAATPVVEAELQPDGEPQPCQRPEHPHDEDHRARDPGEGRRPLDRHAVQLGDVLGRGDVIVGGRRRLDGRHVGKHRSSRGASPDPPAVGSPDRSSLRVDDQVLGAAGGPSVLTTPDFATADHRIDINVDAARGLTVTTRPTG
jgi:hypothetical protein